MQVLSEPVFATLTAGGSHSCAIATTGGVSCWGLGTFGQLGTGSYANTAVPVGSDYLVTGIASVEAGYNHTCAVSTAGGARCWGYNYFGQLGNGTGTNSAVPVDVSGLTSGVASISAGANTSCAVTTGGSVRCWGHNYYGTLGNGTTTNSNVPVQVSGLTSGQVAVSVRGLHHGASLPQDFYGHACAYSSSKTVKCWGHNYYGQLGNGTNTNSTTPVAVSGF